MRTEAPQKSAGRQMPLITTPSVANLERANFGIENREPLPFHTLRILFGITDWTVCEEHVTNVICVYY